MPFSCRVDENLDDIFSKRKKPAKPEKPRMLDKPTVTKPPLKPRPKPELKPKPAPRTTFQESEGGEDELFMVSEGKQSTGVVSVPDKDRPKQSDDKDLFATPRKQSGSFRFVASLIAYNVEFGEGVGWDGDLQW